MKKIIIALLSITAVILLIITSFSSNVINKKQILGLWVNEDNENVIEFNDDGTFIFYTIDMSGKYKCNRDGSLTLKDKEKGEHTFKWDDELPEKYANDTMLIIENIFNWYADENNIYLNGEKLHKQKITVQSLTARFLHFWFVKFYSACCRVIFSL